MKSIIVIELDDFNILQQPDDSTCGPTCLHAVYQYYGDTLSLDQVIQEVKFLKEGGTLAVLLGCHALERGYSATIYTYNLQVFDPTWFSLRNISLSEKLIAQTTVKDDPKLNFAISGYLKFLSLGGEIKFKAITASLLREFLNKKIPILTGLSATFLYMSAREIGSPSVYDDIRGYPVGHFVVLCGYEKGDRLVTVADPLLPNPMSKNQFYDVSIKHLISSILLGILTYDANILIIKPKHDKEGGSKNLYPCL